MLSTRLSLLAILIFVAVIAMPLVNCGGEPAEAACSCEQGKAGEADVWCEKCAKGYVDGQATECKACFEAKQGGPACEECAAKAAAAEEESGSGD